MRKQLVAIQSALRKSASSCKANKLWMDIHQTYGFGAVAGGILSFAPNELESLRQRIIQEVGLDLLYDSLEGDRLDFAEKGVDEKQSGISVFGDGLVMAREKMLPIKLSGGICSTPVGSSVVVDEPQLVASDIEMLVIIENGRLFKRWQDTKLQNSCAGAHLVYRGHGNNVRYLKALIARLHESSSIVYFPDFDASGVLIALSYQPDWLLLPENWQGLADEGARFQALNKLSTFFEQLDDLERLKNCSKGSPDTCQYIRQLAAYIEQHKVAIPQEHLIAHGIELDITACHF